MTFLGYISKSGSTRLRALGNLKSNGKVYLTLDSHVLCLVWIHTRPQIQLVHVLQEIRGSAPKQPPVSPRESCTDHSARFLADWKVVGQRNLTGHAATLGFTLLAQHICDVNQK